MAFISFKSGLGVGAASVGAYATGLALWQVVVIGVATLLVTVLLKLLVLEWFSRKSPGVRGDVLEFAGLLFPASEDNPPAQVEPGTGARRRRSRVRARK
ncbi:hypothetical protein [Kitasatospora sp. NPDC088134]|uniref:hypothetical protein n=1 Tax=Kitasatospora sp. NPDC088134 TaxID=3364071 RepID=UPI0038250A7C